MLKVLNVRRFKQQPIQGMTNKVANVEGFYGAVNRVTDARRISNCQQWATPGADCVQLRVRYCISRDGFIHLQTVYVRSGDSWSCYYDRTNVRIGRCPNGALCYHFLEEDATEPLVGIISSYELHNRKDDAKDVLHAMTKQGPGAFPTTGRGREARATHTSSNIKP